MKSIIGGLGRALIGMLVFSLALQVFQPGDYVKGVLIGIVLVFVAYGGE